MATELDGVRNQVRQHLNEHRTIGLESWETSIDRDRGMPCSDVFVEVVQCSLHDLSHIHGLQRNLNPRQPAVGQQILNQLIEHARFHDDALRIIARAFVEHVTVVFEECVGDAMHAAQRRPQVVRNRVGEGLELRIGQFQ